MLEVEINSIFHFISFEINSECWNWKSTAFVMNYRAGERSISFTLLGALETLHKYTFSTHLNDIAIRLFWIERLWIWNRHRHYRSHYFILFTNMDFFLPVCEPYILFIGTDKVCTARVFVQISYVIAFYHASLSAFQHGFMSDSK